MKQNKKQDKVKRLSPKPASKGKFVDVKQRARTE